MFGIAVRTVTRYTREHPDELDDNEQPLQFPRLLPIHGEKNMSSPVTKRMIRHRNLSCRRNLPPPRQQRYEQENEKDC